MRRIKPLNVSRSIASIFSLFFFFFFFFLFRELVNGIDVNAMASSGMDGLFYALDRLTRQVSGAV
jgi:hypothetical protein